LERSTLPRALSEKLSHLSIPEKAASEFLSSLLAEPSWTADEVEEVTVFVASVIQALRRRSDKTSDFPRGREPRGGK
jgi:hypothetical protein